VNSSGKSFSGPKTGRFHDLEQRAIQYVHEKHIEGFPIMREVIRTKVLELLHKMPILASSKPVPAGTFV
jgi:hypothetical protein